MRLLGELRHHVGLTAKGASKNDLRMYYMPVLKVSERSEAKRRDENPRDESREMATFNTELNFILLHFLLFLLAHCSQPSFKMRLVFARRRQN